MPLNTQCLCGNCFRERLSPSGPCPVCGYDPASEKKGYSLALHPGSILNGKYIIGRVLGQGGFGITYLALDHALNIRVAIKEFFPEGIAVRQTGTVGVHLVSQEVQDAFYHGAQNFLDEARVLARFQGNQNIVGVREFFEENQTAYFVMDYVEGTSLKAYIVDHGGRISWQEAVTVLVPVMDALETVHQHGILHRDVTPDNIYLTKNGTVKLLDFGSAGYTECGQDQETFLKEGYAPIEQYGGHGPQGPYTDVYSLAATFYAALTGFLPPNAEEREARDTLLPLSMQGATAPPELETAILKGLAVQPAGRFQSIAEFRSAAERLNAGKQETFRQETDGKKTVKQETDQTQRNRTEDGTGSGKDGSDSNSQGNSKVISNPKQPKPAGSIVKKLPALLAVAAVLAIVIFSAGGSTSRKTSSVLHDPTPAPVREASQAARELINEEISAVRLLVMDEQAGEYAEQCLKKMGLSVKVVQASPEELDEKARSLDAGGLFPVAIFATPSEIGTAMLGSEILEPDNWEERFYVKDVEKGSLLLELFETMTAEVHVKDEDFYYVSGGDYCGSYTGYIANGNCDGRGTMTYADGRVYSGDWSSGGWNGRGTVTWPNGDRLECDFVENVACGSGVYYWQDGRRYEGEFADDERNGQGSIYYPDGTSKSGIWTDGVLTG